MATSILHSSKRDEEVSLEFHSDSKVAPWNSVRVTRNGELIATFSALDVCDKALALLLGLTRDDSGIKESRHKILGTYLKKHLSLFGDHIVISYYKEDHFLPIHLLFPMRSEENHGILSVYKELQHYIATTEFDNLSPEQEQIRDEARNAMEGSGMIEGVDYINLSSEEETRCHDHTS